MSEEMEGREETVSKKVLVGNSKYREYRLPKSLITDRSCLWRSKCEIGKRVSEILKSKNAKINEYNFKIKQLEKTRESWKTIAKCVTEDNENFFLDALLASEKDIELFERENFLASNSWSKLRKVVDLTEAERQELGVNCADSSVTTENNKPDHYHWVLQKTEPSPTEPIVADQIADGNSVAPVDVPVPATISEVCDRDVETVVEMKTSPTDEEVAISWKDGANTANGIVEMVAEAKKEQRTTSENCSSTTVHDSNLNNEDLSKQTTLNNGTDPCNGTVTEVTETVNSTKQLGSEIKESDIQDVAIVEEMSETTKESLPPAEDQKNPSSFNHDNDASQDKSNSDTSETLKHDETSMELPKTDPEGSTKLPEPKETAVEAADLNSEKFNDTNGTKETNEENGVKVQQLENSNEIAEPNQADCGSEKEQKQEKSSETSKHKCVFPSGFPRLRLTSEQSSVEESEPSPQKVANVWQLRAAEREEKMKAVKEAFPPIESTTASPATSFTPKPLPWVKQQPSSVKKESPMKHERVNPVIQQNTKVAPQPVHSVPVVRKEPVKKTDANGWTTFSSKKGKKNSIDEKGKALNVISVLENGTEKSSSSSAPSPASTIEVEKSDSTNIKPISENVEQTSTDDKSISENGTPVKNAELLEKRTLRRQRVQNKNKEKAKQAKEQEKKLKEQQRMEQEKQIEEVKRKKKEEEDAKFLKKKQEIEAIRQTREDAERLKLTNCDEGLKEMLDVKNRMNDYLKSKQIPYRLIASNCYIATRVKELEEEKPQLEINLTKIRTLLEYKAQMKNLEMKNNHMMFISLQMQEKSKDFKLDDLLAYVHYDHYQIPIEHTSPYQRKVRNAYDQYCKENKCDISENMIKAIQFAENLINKMSAMENRTAPYENALAMLKEYKELHHNIFDFLGLATYLRTRMGHPFFVLEEDYLLNIQHFEDEHAERRNKEIKQVAATKKKSEKKEPEESVKKVEENGVHQNGESVDDEEEEVPECKDGFCQTEERYDVRAASYLPEMPRKPV